MSKFEELGPDWSQFKWRITEIGHLLEDEDTDSPAHCWEFDTQDEAHQFVEMTEIYNPEFEFYWELVRK